MTRTTKAPDYSKDYGKDDHGFCCSVCGDLAPTEAKATAMDDFYVRIFTARHSRRSMTLCKHCWDTGTEIDRDGNELWMDP